MNRSNTPRDRKGGTPDERPPRARRLLRAALFGVGLTAAVGVYAYLTAEDELGFRLRDLVVTEVTGLEHIQVAEVRRPKSIEEISQLLAQSSGPVSIGGARASMGGQVAEPGSLHLDLRSYNRVLSLDPIGRRVTVEAGATWRDLLDVLDPHDLSIRIMQTYSNFTVGGSLSVNAHGRYMAQGPIVQSVEALRLVLADGQIVNASRSENSELFWGVIGGYGSLAVIAEVTLSLAENCRVERITETLEAEDYGDFFGRKIREDAAVIFQNADLHPPDFRSARSVSWRKTDKPLTEPERLIPRGQSYPLTSRYINSSLSFPFGFALRRHVVEPLFYSRSVVTTRNHEASYDVAELEPTSRDHKTYALREYFVPVERYRDFLPKMRAIFSEYRADVINISVRHATPDPGTVMAWSRGETFAFVVYYEQGTDPSSIQRVGEWSRAMVDAVLEVGGTYYLPYQNHPTRAQFDRAYPRAQELFALKRRVDPTLRFQNSLWAHYGPSPRVEREVELERRAYPGKPEGRTLLTIPEWYLVWNPGEYADHLERNRPSDTFPFFASVREYWSLYKKVLRASEGVYPEDGEYLTTLRVIGVSTTLEYVVKGLYETTVGRAFRLFGDLPPSQEDLVMARAYRRYAEFVYDEPWYAFRFLPYVREVWRPAFFGPSFLRRTERKLFFTLEFTMKAAYAAALGWAAGTAYGPADERVAALLQAAPEGSLPAGVTLKATLPSGERWVELGRWRSFSEKVPELAAQGHEFIDIAHNDEIAVTLVQPRDYRADSPHARLLFRSRVLGDPSQVRLAYWVSVPKLARFLRESAARGARIEHLYDY